MLQKKEWLPFYILYKINLVSINQKTQIYLIKTLFQKWVLYGKVYLLIKKNNMKIKLNKIKTDMIMKKKIINNKKSDNILLFFINKIIL